MKPLRVPSAPGCVLMPCHLQCPRVFPSPGTLAWVARGPWECGWWQGQRLRSGDEQVPCLDWTSRDAWLGVFTRGGQGGRHTPRLSCGGPAFEGMVGGPRGAAQSLAVCSVPLSAEKLTSGLRVLALLVLVTGPQSGSPDQGTGQAPAGHPALGAEPSRTGACQLACLSSQQPVLVEATPCATGPWWQHGHGPGPFRGRPARPDALEVRCHGPGLSRIWGGRRCAFFIMLSLIILFSWQIKPQTRACQNRTGPLSRTSVTR